MPNLDMLLRRRLSLRYTRPMVFLVVSIVVPVVIFVALPAILRAVGVRRPASRLLLLVSCIAFFISWYLPSPLIDGKNTQFMTHLVGGGLFSGLLWVYLKRSFAWRGSWWIEAMSLFALVSALGVANELFEWAIVQAGIVRLSLSDTSWDLVANTFGAALAWCAYLMFDQSSSKANH